MPCEMDPGVADLEPLSPWCAPSSLLPHLIQLVRLSKTPPFVDGRANIVVLITRCGAEYLVELHPRDEAKAMLWRRIAAPLEEHEPWQGPWEALEAIATWPTCVCFVWLNPGWAVVLALRERELTELLALAAPARRTDAV